MSPPAKATVEVEPEESSVSQPSPCTIHDDRIRELEQGYAAHEAQLRAGSSMFESIQDSIRMLSNHVSDSMSRVESTVARVGDDVRQVATQLADVRVQQAEQAAAVAELKQDKTEREERWKVYRENILRYLVPAGLVIAGTLAGAHGKQWLAELLKAIAG